MMRTLPLLFIAITLSRSLFCLPEQEMAKQARQLLSEAKFDEAAILYQKLLNRQAADDRSKVGLAVSLIYRNGRNYQNDLNKAIALLNESIQLHSMIPNSNQPLAFRYFQLGIAYWYLGRSDFALAAFDRCYLADRSMTAAVFNSITILEELGRFEEANQKKQFYRQIATENSVTPNN
ncbi:MAG: tetratricopeptide repeat protein [Leptonema sp. (in: Bacteria)]|nr:tetratricopeptide repeat protein [Leptonema sp. (in: bacteria)]